MFKDKVSQLLLFLLLADLLVCTFSIQSAAASGDIYIRADGSIDPLGTPIQRNANLYTFTDNIYGNIIVQRDNIIVDGAGRTLQGTGVEIGIDLSSRTNVTIQNMVVRTFYDAIYLSSSNQITISGTNVADNTDDGIRISDSSNNNISQNNIAGNDYEGIYVLTSSNNTISENNITTTTGDGVYLWGSSNDAIFGNNISNNWWGVTSFYSSNNRIFHNNFVNNPSQAYSESSVDIWNDNYPSGGNYWSDYNGFDQKCGPNRDHPGSDTMGDTSYTIDSSNQDNYPLMNPWAPPSGHDVKVISLVSAKIVICQGFSGNITVYGANRGEYPEDFNVTTYANTTRITSETMHNLGSDSTTTITLVWIATDSSFSIGNYTVKAYAEPVPGETNVYDNNFTGGWVMVTRVGDVSMDNKVDGRDLLILSRAFGSYGPDYYYPGSPATLGWNPNADITNDNKVDGRDLLVASRHFGEGA